MTLSNMFSINKQHDQKHLLTITELIETLVRIGTTECIDRAEDWGDEYIKLEEKIRTYNYTEDDSKTEKFYKQLDEINA